MTFPLAITTELLLDGTWTDISGDVRQASAVTIKRGRSDESAQVDPSTCNLTLDNSTGNYSPRNPTGTHFGVLGRNTPLRVRTPGTQEGYMILPGDEGQTVSYAGTPDHASLDITGDIDIRLDIEPETWRPDLGYALTGKYRADGDQFSWAVTYFDGTIRLLWSTTGTLGALVVADSTVVVPEASTRLALRVTLDVDNGASGWDAKFYTAPDIDGSWTQLGATVTGAGVTSIFSGNGDVLVGTTTVDGVSDPALEGKVYAFELYNGIAGTLVASPDFTTAPTVVTSFDDAQGRTWTLTGNALVVNPNVRFHGEVSTWPQRWDPSGNDVYAPIEASGVLRRLQQGAPALKSTLYRGLTTLASAVVAYWPCEDDSGATEIASALPGGTPMAVSGTGTGTADLASFSDFKASAPIPTVTGSRWTGRVPAYDVTDQAQMRFLLAVPAAGVSVTTTLAYIFTTGSVRAWHLQVDVSGNLRLLGFDAEDIQVADSGLMAFDVNGRLLRASVELSMDGTDLVWIVATIEVGAGAGFVLESAPLAGETVGQVTHVSINPGVLAEDVAVGHVSVQSLVTDIFDLFEELNAYADESAADRILRLCKQEGVTAAIVRGDLEPDTALVGPQLPKTLIELLREAADADLGILYEPRSFLGLAYRTRASLYAQTATVELDYATADLSEIEPVEDDQATRNDVTAKRVNGASARAELTEGALSVNPPPDGVGRYDTEVSLNVATDSQLPDQAGWRLHLGTVDEARYPVLGLNLARGVFTGELEAIAGLHVDGTSGTYASAPDAAALDITADIDIRVHVALDDWTPSADEHVLVAKWAGGGQNSWIFRVTPAGLLNFTGSATGGDVPINASSTVATGYVDGSGHWVRVTRAQTSGDHKFYTSEDGETWTQLGATVTTAAGVAIFAGTSALSVGARDGGTTERLSGVVGYVEVRDGIDGSVVADPDFASQAVGTASFSDGLNTWTLNGGAEIARGPLAANTEALDVGDRITVANPPAWLPPDDISQLAQGFTETLTRFEWLIDVNCSPASPWDIAVYDDSTGPGEARYESDGTVLNEDLDTTETSVEVFTDLGPTWSDADQPFDIVVGGERMTVTAVAFPGSQAQTFTVTRSVNGVVKTHSTDAEVRLFKPGIYAL